MGSDVLVFTACYPAAMAFVGAWYAGLKPQLDDGVAVCVALDGVEPEDVFAACGERFAADFVRAQAGDTPAQVRNRALEHRAGHYDAVVLTDSDDVPLPGRIAAARESVVDHDVVATAMDLVNEDGSATGIAFELPEQPERLETENVFGFSNTVWRGPSLERCLPAPEACVAMDWYVATAAWILGMSLGLDRRRLMAYRQYEANTAGVLPPFTAQRVLNGARIAMSHCRFVLEGPARGREEWEEIFSRRLATVSDFEAAMADDSIVHNYLESLNRLAPAMPWWRWVAHPDLEESWKS